MAKQQIKAGFTDYTTLVFIPDPASTDGSGKTGLVAANLTVSGVRVETDNDVTVTDYTSSLNNLAALTTAHTDWGLLEVSSTLAPGLYRLDIADAIFAAGAWSAVVYVMITTSAAAASPMEFTLVAHDINDGVRMGLTALPNAAADAAGGLVISDAGGLDADAQRADVAAILVDTGTTLDARIPAALVGGRMDASVGAMAANVQTAASTAADYVTELQAGLSTLDAAGVRTAVGLASANLDTQLAAIAGYIDTEVGTLQTTATAIKAVTDVLPNAGALTTIQSDLDNIQTRIPAALTAGGNMKSDMLAISGSTTAADNLEGGGLGLVVSTCAAGGTTTSIVTNLTEATDDHYNGRVITFTSGALAGQTTSISDYVGATKTLTVVALTEAPADTDGFVIS
jgi:hypothetical protein